MRARILGLVSLCFLGAGYLLGAAQTAGDKKSDQPPKKEPEVTADTVINGKIFKEWVALISGKDRSLTEAACASILLYPPNVAKNAIPAMLGELKKHKPSSPIDMSVRTDIPGPLALILTSLPQPNPNEMAETVAVLKTMATDQQIIVRIRAIQALGQLGPNAKTTLPELINAVRDAYSLTWELRNAAVTALGRVGYEEKNPPQEQVVKTLLLATKDLAFKVRISALSSLHTIRAGEFDQYKKEMLTGLQTMATKDTDPLCRLRAHLSIYEMLKKDDEKKARIVSIAEYLTHPEPALRLETAVVLGQLGPDAKDMVPKLLSSVRQNKTKDLEMVRLCIWALGQIGKAAAPALDELRQIASDMNMPELIRLTANEAIDGVLGTPKKKDEPKKR